MSITYAEIKHRLTDFGFEEDDVTEADYKRIFINALNHSGEIIYNVVMLEIEDYIRKVEEQDDLEEPLRKITKITEDTEDSARIYIPEIVQPLYPLLAAHYAWLDDDLTKAMIYWNEFDDLKDRIIATAKRARKATIIGGW
jgi:hypothetical protein